MKKLILLLAIFSFCLNVDAQRFATGAGNDNTGRVLTYDYKTPAYATAIAIAPNAFETIVKPGTLTGSLSMTAVTTNAKVGDKVYVMFITSGAARTVTFSTGYVPSATLVVDSAQRASIGFIYNGSAFVEFGRAKE